jgi:hypothetical protein
MENCPVCRSMTYKSGSMGKSVISGYVCSEKKEALSEQIYDIEINFCANCSALFQKKYNTADIILNKIYTQHEATIRNSDQYISYYEQFANKVTENLNSLIDSAKILEIGCNDGLLLGLIGSKCNAKLYGFEPSVNFKDKWKEQNIIGVNDFFGAETASIMRQAFGEMNVVIARHVLEHIANPHDFFEGLRLISNTDTTMFIEVPYLASIFQLNRFENVGYSHLVHYSIKSMVTLAEKYGFMVTDFNLCDMDGGSIVFKLKHLTAVNSIRVKLPQIEAELGALFGKFLSDFEESKVHLSEYLNDHEGEVFVGFGAGAKGQFLIHLYGLQEFLVAVIDETPGYAGKFIPGTEISIVDLNYLNRIKTATVINLAPTHAQAVMKKIPQKFTFLDPINKICTVNPSKSKKYMLS